MGVTFFKTLYFVWLLVFKGEVQPKFIWLKFSCGSQECRFLYTPVTHFQQTVGWSPLSTDVRACPGSGKITTIWSGSAHMPGRTVESLSRPLLPPLPQPSAPVSTGAEQWAVTDGHQLFTQGALRTEQSVVFDSLVLSVKSRQGADAAST